MKINEMYSSKFLRAADVDSIANADGTALVTIDRVVMAEVGQEQQEKPVVYFRDIDPGLVLNKTNATTLAGLLGNDTDAWEGKTVGLFTTEVDFQGKQTLAIRVRMRLPKQQKAKVVETTEDDMPF